MLIKTTRYLLYTTLSVYVLAILIWTILFYRNPFLKDVLIDIHLIFSSTLVVYLLIRLLLSLSAMDFIKVFIRTLFRVWLLIFITFAISSSTEGIGILLSLTFIFGYIEGLLDINKWLESSPNSPFLSTKDLAKNKYNHAMISMLLMSSIHIFCAGAICVFYLLF
jgi:hypothetical protein